MMKGRPAEKAGRNSPPRYAPKGSGLVTSRGLLHGHSPATGFISTVGTLSPSGWAGSLMVRHQGSLPDHSKHRFNCDASEPKTTNCISPGAWVGLSCLCQSRDCRVLGGWGSALTVVVHRFLSQPPSQRDASRASHRRVQSSLQAILRVDHRRRRSGRDEQCHPDDSSWNAVENLVHVHDLDPAMLDPLGVEHVTLTLHFQSRESRLTDAGGCVLVPVLA